MKKYSSLHNLIVFISILTFAFPALAGEETTGDYASGMGKQLGRGLWNVVSSPAEIPCTMGDDMKDNAAAGFFTGLGKGLVFMGRRIIVGVSELGTFFLPAPPVLPGVCTEAKPTV